MNKICHITTVHFGFDGRIFYKEAKTLAKVGYNVALIAQHNRSETVDGIAIVALPRAQNRCHRMLGLTLNVFYMTLREKAHVYHFHDPELLPVGIILKLLTKKVIYDVHEDVPKQILNKDWIESIRTRKLVAFAVNVIEKVGSSLLDGIIAATPAIGQEFNPIKTIILRNLPILELIDKAKKLEIEEKKPVIIYAGGLTRIRGIKEIIRGMEFIGKEAELWLLGKWESKEFKKECASQKGYQYTKYLGFFKLEEVYSYLKVANIGLVNFLPVENHLTSMPSKPFEYMACSLPMVMSNFPYWQKIFGECALFVDPYNPKDIADKILYLLNNPREARKLGDRGRKLVEEKYSWETESKKLTRLYEELLN